MAIKLAVIVLFAALTTVTACSEKEKRQSGPPDFSEYFNQFKEQMKPITSQFPSLPNGVGSFSGFPGMEGSSGFPGGSSQSKREVNPNTVSEWFNQFQETGNKFSENFPLRPSGGQFPFQGSSSGSSQPSGNQNA